MARLDLDSGMDLSDVFEAMDEVSSENQTCDEIFLNCIDIDLPIAAALTQFLRQHEQVWKSIDLEECTGEAFEALLTVVFTCRVSRVKVSSVGLGPLSEASLLAVALGMQSNQYLKKLILSISLTAESATWLSKGLSNLAGVRSFCLWDCTVDAAAAHILSEGLSRATILQEFALVACGVCGERLGTILEAFSENTFLKQLDLRCCLASSLSPVVRLLQQNSSLQTLDLSFQSGSDGLDVHILHDALRDHPTLENLHICRNYIGDAGFDTLLDAAQASTSLRVLNLSLNSITTVEHLAERLGNNELPLRRLLLDGNPIEDPSPLVDALETTNTTLESCLIPQHFEKEQQLLHYYTRLNRGGRRLVLGQERIPHYLWPFVFERANRLDFDNCSNSVARAEVLYCLLHGPIFFPV
jgi:Ran GTPase-activating protein (RanGAP) involved in mRNA processing and transport